MEIGRKQDEYIVLPLPEREEHRQAPAVPTTEPEHEPAQPGEERVPA